ncbi:MAG: TonB-dependent receptor [Candidatus Omnitrophica bacterium]|nr:TonB-dependent receptor [Candidatus Omnitrophota bacterium]
MKNHTLIFLAILVAAWPAPVTAAEDASVEQMMEMSLEELLDITVTSAGGREQRMKEVSHAMFVISREDIERSGARNVPDLLEKVPGMHVQSIDANRYQVSIRGVPDLATFNLLVLVDGVIVYNPIFNGTVWESIYVSLDEIDRIEVIRGPGGVLYSQNSVNGVINIITRAATDTENYVSLRAGNFDYRSAVFGAGHQNDKLSVRTYGDFSFDNGYDKIRSVGRLNNRAEEEAAGFKVQYDFTPDRKLVLDGKYKNFDGNNRGILGMSQGKWQAEMYGGSARFDQRVDDRYDYFAKLDVIQHTFSFLSTHDSDVVAFSGLTQHNLHYDLAGRHIASLGAELRFSQANTNKLVFPAPAADAQRSQRVLSYFIQDEYRPADKWIITPGLRVNSNDMVPDHVDKYLLEPRLAVLYKLHPKHSLLVSGGRSYRTPSMVERFSQLPLQGGLTYAGTPDLEPERIHNYEIGWRGLMLEDRLSLNATAFKRKTTNLQIITELQGTSFLFDNNGKMTSTGLELDGQYSWNERLTLYGDYTYLHQQTYPDNNAQYYYFDFLEQKFSKHQIGLGLRWTKDRWKCDFYVKWHEGFRQPASVDGLLSPLSEEYSDYIKTKIRIAYAFAFPGLHMDADDAELELVINDLFGDNINESEANYYREPDVWLGLKVKF